MGVQQISDRVSYKKHGDYTTFVITPRADQSKMFLLTFWIFSWTFCGSYVIYELITGDYKKEIDLILVVFLSFWAYYEYRIGYVWIWRRKGIELIKIEDGVLSYKRSLRTYGKVHQFHIDNIRDFGLTEHKPLNTFMGDSFWVLGNERLRFEYQGREVRFGIQLSEEEAGKLQKALLFAMESEAKKTTGK